ncbi:MAG: protein kinase [Victivallales bacterium]|nr:protein kinase [Victivallales bacterium]
MAFLLYENHDGTRAIPIDDVSSTFNVGRSMDNDLRLREDSLISRHHCTIFRSDIGQFVIRDLGSINGTYVNDYCVRNEDYVVEDMDQIAVGNMIFVFMKSDNIEYTLADTTTIMVNSSTPDISAPDDSLLAETAKLVPIIPPHSEVGKISGKHIPVEVYPEIEGFEILNPLGRSSICNFSASYLAFQKALKRTTVVKIFDTSLLDDQQRESFLTHVRAAGKLQHPNIVSYIDAGSTQTHCYLTMHYADAGSLRDKLANSGPISEKDAVRCIIKISEALNHALSSGIMHYNVTSSNILFDKAGEPAISDFGLAEWIAHSYQINRNYFFGSTVNMAPEQMLDKALDWTCDQYALGTVFYEMLAGKPCFEAPSIYALIEKHLREKIRFPMGAKVSAGVADIICKMMGKTPDQRFGSWQAVISALKSSMSNPQLKSSDMSRKNIPLKHKGIVNISKQGPVIQIRGPKNRKLTSLK